jgi:hypothetical protein
MKSQLILSKLFKGLPDIIMSVKVYLKMYKKKRVVLYEKKRERNKIELNCANKGGFPQV